MFLLQKGGVSARFSGQIFGFCPIRKAKLAEAHEG